MSDFFNSFIVGHNIWWLIAAFALGLLVGWWTCERVPHNQRQINR